MKEIAVVEIIKPMPGKSKELKKALEELVPICRKGTGCLQYELFENKDEFLVLMRWTEFKYLTQHEASPPIQEFVRKYDKILYGDVVQTEWTHVL